VPCPVSRTERVARPVIAAQKSADGIVCAWQLACQVG
jgi:hypothetical protein